jgi:hypothetical protein
MVQGKDKKKVGRPITYKGDPEASNLTEEERRRIKRRIANRESARRVRQKRHDLMGELQMNVSLGYLSVIEASIYTANLAALGSCTAFFE